jgi:hypothetical protein
MEYQYILNTILIFFNSTHWKISSIGAFLHNSFAGRMWPAGRSLETLDLRLSRMVGHQEKKWRDGGGMS